MRGTSIGIVYSACLDYDASLAGTAIPGVSKAMQKKMSRVWFARWTYFHRSIYTAAYMLNQRYCQIEFDAQQESELRKYFKKIATKRHTYSEIANDYTSFINAVGAESYELNDKEGFSVKAVDMAPYAWWQTHRYFVPHLQFVAVRFGALRIGSSVSEKH